MPGNINPINRTTTNLFGKTRGGISISSYEGTPVFSIVSGVVFNGISSKFDSSGNQLWILGDNKFLYSYSKLKLASKFKVGERIEIGELIGFVGRTITTAGKITRSSQQASLKLDIYTKQGNEYVKIEPRKVNVV